MGVAVASVNTRCSRHDPKGRRGQIPSAGARPAGESGPNPDDARPVCVTDSRWPTTNSGGGGTSRGPFHPRSAGSRYYRAVPLSSGDVFAGYTVVRLLGAGGMGEVYLVRHPRLPRHDALKVLPPDLTEDQEFRQRLNREADLAATLWHPHIVGLHDRGEYRGQLWLTMDYVDGSDTAHLLRNSPEGLAVAEVSEIVAAVADALDYAHERGLLHRDIKPANILVAESAGGRRRVLLTDFGIARQADDVSGLTATNMTIGTISYASPEQLMGEALSGSSDQYALAATAFHLLSGSPVFPHTNPAVVISRHLNTPPPQLSDAHPDLQGFDTAFAQGLAKDPADRYQTCTNFAEAFAEAAQEFAKSRLAEPPTAPALLARSATDTPTVHHSTPPVVVSSWADDPKARVASDRPTELPTRRSPPPQVKRARDATGRAGQPVAGHPSLPLKVGSCARIIESGEHFGRVGTVTALWDDDDEFDVCLRFDGDAEPYAFMRHELAPVTAPDSAPDHPFASGVDNASPRSSAATQQPASVISDSSPIDTWVPSVTAEPPIPRSRPIYLFALLALLLITSGTTAAIQTVRASNMTTASEWQPFVDTARSAAIYLTSIDYQTVERDVQRIVDSSTGTFHVDFLQRADPFTKTVLDAKSVSQGTVSGAGIERQSGQGEATVLVAVTVTTTKDNEPQEPKAWRMRITVTETDSGLKASNVEFVE